MPDRQSQYTSKFRRCTATALHLFDTVPRAPLFLVATSAYFFAGLHRPASVSALSAFFPNVRTRRKPEVQGALMLCYAAADSA